MELKEVIARINELYHQSQQSELTAVEIEERDRLRRIYLDAMKQQIKGTLDRIEIVDPEPDTAEQAGHHHDGCNCGCKH